MNVGSNAALATLSDSRATSVEKASAFKLKFFSKARAMHCSIVKEGAEANGGGAAGSWAVPFGLAAGRGVRMAAMKPRTGDGPLEVTKEGRGIVMRVPLEGGGRLVVELSATEAAALGDALKSATG